MPKTGEVLVGAVVAHNSFVVEKDTGEAEWDSWNSQSHRLTCAGNPNNYSHYSESGLECNVHYIDSWCTMVEHENETYWVADFGKVDLELLESSDSLRSSSTHFDLLSFDLDPQCFYERVHVSVVLAVFRIGVYSEYI